MSKYSVQRNLDGVYYRQKRDGKWMNICFTDMTYEEQEAILKKYNRRQLMRMAYIMAGVIRNIDEQINPADTEWEAVFNKCDIDADNLKDTVFTLACTVRELGDKLNIVKE